MLTYWKDLLERALTAAAASVAALQTSGALPHDWKTLLSVGGGAAFWAVVNGLAAGKVGDPSSAGFVKNKPSQEALLKALREKLSK